VPGRGRSGKWWLAEVILLGLALMLVLIAAVAAEPEEGTPVLPSSVLYVVLATPLVVSALIGIVARPLAGLLALVVGVLAVAAGLGGSSWTGLAVGVLLLFDGGLFIADALERDFADQPSAVAEPSSAAAPGGNSREPLTGDTGSRPEERASRTFERVEVVNLAGLPVPPALVTDLVRRLRAADLDATAETLERALTTGETMPDASSPDRFALTVPDREALLRVLDEQCPVELVELRSLLRADHDSRVRSGIWADATITLS
jgi:hypothetical protein